jgi:DNA-binding MarR family transcriptional regulator
MSELGRNPDIHNERIVLGLLESVQRDGAQSQRKLASELGIALGLVNAYLKRCIKKGLVKVGEAPAQRYFYYLTPQGFAEKSRLTVEYLSYSFTFFRQARADCARVLELAKSRGVQRVILAGNSDLADIMRICTLECGVQIVAVVDSRMGAGSVGEIALVKSFDDVASEFDAVVVTDLSASTDTHTAAVERFGAARVYAPALLGVAHQQETVR